uniref:SHSP domain-containing protein n=1 Tax=Panagrolaimus sp. JU765 TaxID=591449 RepID=A0AC34QWG5_9BILA
MSGFRRFRDPLVSPFFHSRFFDDFEFDRALRTPYWADKNLYDGQRFGDGVGEVVDNDEGFKVEVDVSHFRPEELTVTVVESQLVIEGKHDEKTDKYGKIERHFVRKYNLPANTKPEDIERHFVRKYNLPPNTKPEDVTSELSKDGILTVQTAKKQVEESKVRNIPIQARP